MIKKIIATVVLCLGCYSQAQEFLGKAEYFSKVIINSDDTELSSEEAAKNIDPELMKKIQDAVKKASEKSYLLTFNKFESLYEVQQELEKPQVQDGFSISISMAGEGKRYMNVKDKIYLEEAEIVGKEFIISEELKPIAWQLFEETKKIGDYTCYKAEVTLPVPEKVQKEYEEFLEQEKKKPQLFKMKEPKPTKVTAWYTPEIPVSLGPLNYWGLPGLILEVNEKDRIILCSKVTLSKNKSTAIKAPSNGKKVSQKEFDAIEKAKMDSMKDEDGTIIFQTTRE